MTGIVWGADYQRAVDKLDEVIKDYKELNIPMTYKSVTKSRKQIMFENGDVWYALRADTLSNDIKCHECYIDRDIDWLIKREVCLPSVAFSSGAIKYYDGGQIFKSRSW